MISWAVSKEYARPVFTEDETQHVLTDAGRERADAIIAADPGMFGG